MLDQGLGAFEVSEASGPPEALHLLESYAFDVVVTEVALAGRSGIGLIEQILRLRPNVPVLVFSSRDESVYAERVLRAGASGFISKSADATRFIEAVRRVLSGQVYASSSVSRYILAGGSGGRADGGAVDHLSDREFAVFELIGQGHRRGEIARLLELSPQTVGSYRARIMEKLEIEGAAHLAQVAVKWVASNS